MSKLLKVTAIGAVIGAGTAFVMHQYNKRVEENPETPLPSALTAIAETLNPLLGAGLLFARNVLDELIKQGSDANTSEDDNGERAQPRHSDTEHGSDTEPNADASEDASSTTKPTLLDQGHPAGPGYAPTPA